ncbi:MAG: hypothetical protein F6K10_27695 [Moorea sp. SIO2B7]|nr:hypothetical protein [Moorena sp. SIO2B7]
MVRQLSLEFEKSEIFNYRKIFQASFYFNPCFVYNKMVIFEEDNFKRMKIIKHEIVDVIFAYPPFNIGKNYGKDFNYSMDIHNSDVIIERLTQGNLQAHKTDDYVEA